MISNYNHIYREKTLKLWKINKVVLILSIGPMVQDFVARITVDLFARMGRSRPRWTNDPERNSITQNKIAAIAEKHRVKNPVILYIIN